MLEFVMSNRDKIEINSNQNMISMLCQSTQIRCSYDGKTRITIWNQYKAQVRDGRTQPMTLHILDSGHVR